MLCVTGVFSRDMIKKFLFQFYTWVWIAWAFDHFVLLMLAVPSLTLEQLVCVCICVCVARDSGFFVFPANVAASTQSDEMSWPEIVLAVLGVILLIILILLVLFFCCRQHLVKWCKWICLCLLRSSWNTVLTPRCRETLWQNGKMVWLWPGTGRGIRMEKADCILSSCQQWFIYMYFSLLSVWTRIWSHCFLVDLVVLCCLMGFCHLSL